MNTTASIVACPICYCVPCACKQTYFEPVPPNYTDHMDRIASALERIADALERKP